MKLNKIADGSLVTAVYGLTLRTGAKCSKSFEFCMTSISSGRKVLGMGKRYKANFFLNLRDSCFLIPSKIEG